ncbi:hypothetical protein RJJ37_13095 [Rhizobium redzepovicii]|uniref:Uncharacterized protein n=1 Tax=Rhizobium redzepovicii TaxID=2867518 RepID=A0AAW8P354_9HYPH|nr:hypothetical protein [Rhizobium redzepovicii]MDR9760564.1 hypothetical protein [Rhizobium redzepovicii]
MTDKLSMYASTPSTVHSWSTQTQNKTFRSLQKAIEYAGEHVDELSTLEVFIHNGDQRELIVSGAELRSLITLVCHH